MTYRDISKATGIALMTLWELGNDGAQNVAAPTLRRNYERIERVVLEQLKRTNLKAFTKMRFAKQAGRRKNNRRIIMPDIDTIDLDDRVHLKAVRTAFNEYNNRNRGDEGYFYMYSEEDDATVLENLKRAVDVEIGRNSNWLSKAPDLILMFTEAAGLIPDSDEKVEDADDEEAVMVEEDDDDAEQPAQDDDDDEESDEESTVVEETVDDEEDDEDGDDTIVYTIEADPVNSVGALSKLFQDLANAYRQADASVIEIIKHPSDVVCATKPKDSAAPKVPTVEEIRKRLVMGGDLLNRTKRAEFIKANGIPTKGKPEDLTPKEMTALILDWAEKQNVGSK